MILKKGDLSQKYLKECLKYNQKTGVFIWKERPIDHFLHCQFPKQVYSSWNSRHCGEMAGQINNCGYLVITIDKIVFQSHRLAWLYVEGYFPESQIDHIDRDKLNNRWSNLREVSPQCNCRNRGLTKRNSSGIVGVTFKKNQGWVAYVSVNKKVRYLGTFKDFDLAVLARWNAEVKHNYPNCCKSSTAYNYLVEKVDQCYIKNILDIIEQLEKEIPIDGRQDNFHMIHDYEDRWRVLKERVNNLTEGEYNEKV